MLEGVPKEVKGSYRKGSANCRIFWEYSSIAWCHYLWGSNDMEAISTPEDQYALNKPASLVARVAMVGVVAPTKFLLSSPAMPVD